MASFREDSNDNQDSDWGLLFYGPVTLYMRVDVLERHLEWLRAHHYVVNDLDARDWASEEDFHRGVQRGLGLPESYHHNLDVFTDFARELPVPDVGGRAIVFRAFDTFFRTCPSVAHAALDILAVCSRHRSLVGQRLVILVQAETRLPIDPVGAVPVGWSREEERLMKRRGRAETP